MVSSFTLIQFRENLSSQWCGDVSETRSSMSAQLHFLCLDYDYYNVNFNQIYILSIKYIKCIKNSYYLHSLSIYICQPQFCVSARTETAIYLLAINITSPVFSGLPWWLSGKESACQAGDSSSITGSRRCPGEGNGTPLQYSCLENPMDRGAWRVTVAKESDMIWRPNDYNNSSLLHGTHCILP